MAEFPEDDVERVVGAFQGRAEGAVEMQAFFFQPDAGAMRLGHALLA